MAPPHDPLSGRVGHLSEDQQHALTTFRENLLKSGLIPQDTAAAKEKIGYDRYDDPTLLRFLRARKFDLAAAETMWKNNEEWRAKEGVDDIAANGYDYPEAAEVDKYYPQFYHKTDVDGRPVYIEQLGKLDYNKLYALTTQERQLKKLVSEYEKFFKERLPACSAMKGELVETSCTILDLKNAGISTFYKGESALTALRKSRITSAPPPRSARTTPETMGHMYIVNAPMLFSTIWSIVKGWLDPATVAKIHILGSGYSKELQKQIPPENLPKDLGGTCNCPGGCSLSNAGPWNKDIGSAPYRDNAAGPGFEGA